MTRQPPSRDRMPSRRTVLRASAVGAGALAAGTVAPIRSAAAAPRPIGVDPTRTYQTIRAWGTALSWGANAIGDWDDVAARTEIVDLLFDQAKGLGLTATRYNIGATENPDHDHMRLAADIPSLWPKRPGEWNLTSDAAQRWVLEQALARGADTVDAFVTSPHYWWTHSGCVSGSVAGDTNNLKREHLGDFADYVTEVAKVFRETWGIRFDSLAPVNEPTAWWWKALGSQEGCYFSRPYQNEVLKAVGRRLADKGLDADTRLAMPEEYGPGWTVDTLNAFDDPAVADLLGQINTHSYGDGRRPQLRDYAQAAGKPLSMAEYGTAGDAGYQPQHISNALNLSRRLLLDLRKLRPQEWTIWNAVESIEANKGGDTCWGLIHASYTPGQQDFYIAKQYYGYANYVRFLRPGFAVVGCGDPNAVAAYDSLRKRLVIVYTAFGPGDRTVTFDLSAFRPSAGVVKRYRTSANENLAELGNELHHAHTYSTTVPGDSITTFEFPGMPY